MTIVGNLSRLFSNKNTAFLGYLNLKYENIEACHLRNQRRMISHEISYGVSEEIKEIWKLTINKDT